MEEPLLLEVEGLLLVYEERGGSVDREEVVSAGEWDGYARDRDAYASSVLRDP